MACQTRQDRQQGKGHGAGCLRHQPSGHSEDSDCGSAQPSLRLHHLSEGRSRHHHPGGLCWGRCVARWHSPLHQELCLSRSEEHTSELQSLLSNSYAVFCLTNKKQDNVITPITHTHLLVLLLLTTLESKYPTTH